MSTHKSIDKICCIIMIFTIILTFFFCNGRKLGIKQADKVLGYESKLFDASYVHTIDIVMNSWDEFIEGCEDEEYENCAVIIDNEAYKNVGIRAKGNTSLSSVSAYGNDRYSFKIEFDHYDAGKTYYGLDKISLNNIIQDNTYMKDYIVYRMMTYFGVDSPLCSYVFISINGESFGLYLAVEGIEESFLTRNYGADYGELYKPDTIQTGGDIGGIGADDVALIYTDDNYESYSDIFENAKTDISDEDKDRLIESIKCLNENQNIESVVNVDEVIRYFVVHNYVCNFDSYTGSMLHNYYLYEEDGMMSMIPWDYNLAFGGFSVGGGENENATKLVNYPIDTPVSDGTIDAKPMLAWIFADEEYLELYHEYFEEFIIECFDSGYLYNLIDETYNMISSYVENDMTKFSTYEEFEKGVEVLCAFCELRTKSIKGQLDGTIPSTEYAQRENGTALIEVENINIEDMGSMGDIEGKGAPQMPDKPYENMPQAPKKPDGEKIPR